MTKDIVIQNILFFIRKRRMMVGDFERRIGVSKGYMSRCKGIKSISLDRVLRAAEVLEVPVSSLLDENFALRAELEEVNSQIDGLRERKGELERELGYERI